jgi:serine/threonine protein kinase
MAPEILSSRDGGYSGFSVDIFNLGTMLFLMVLATPPFGRAVPTDPFYNTIIMNEWYKFWDNHGRKFHGGIEGLGNNFIHFITYLIQPEPSLRLSTDEVKEHPYFSEETATKEGLIADMSHRIYKIQEASSEDILDLNSSITNNIFIGPIS